MGYNNGTLVYAESFEITFSCPFSFANFPFDSQKCCLGYFAPLENLYMGITANVSYEHINSSAFNVMKKLPFEITVKPVETEVLVINQEKMYVTGMCIEMERKSSNFLLSSYYFPTLTFALISMISFLIKSDVVSIYHPMF